MLPTRILDLGIHARNAAAIVRAEKSSAVYVSDPRYPAWETSGHTKRATSKEESPPDLLSFLRAGPPERRRRTGRLIGEGPDPPKADGAGPDQKAIGVNR